uniref:WGS project CBMI000000000 data, contig CS3069_c004908 n=1 Tax=Fusarium clavum TaxID=2594811 RepID=A0A090N652_9HYPO|nr:unnamed protein product [Fusarium clavum]
MHFSFLVAALAIGASAAPAPQLKVEAVNDLVDVDSDKLAGLSTLLAGLGITAKPVKVLTPIGPGAKAKRQLKVTAVNGLVDVDSDKLAGLSTLLAGLGITAKPVKVLDPIGPGAGAIPGAKTKRQLKVEAVNDLVDVDSDKLAGLSELLAGLGITAKPVKVLTPIGPGLSGPSLPGAKAKRQLKVEAVNDLVDIDSDKLAGLSELLAGLGITVPAKVLTPIGPGVPGAKEKRQLKVEAVNDLVDVDSDKLAGLSELLAGLGITAKPVKVLTPIGPGAKREVEAEKA